MSKKKKEETVMSLHQFSMTPMPMPGELSSPDPKMRLPEDVTFVGPWKPIGTEVAPLPGGGGHLAVIWTREVRVPKGTVQAREAAASSSASGKEPRIIPYSEADLSRLKG